MAMIGYTVIGVKMVDFKEEVFNLNKKYEENDCHGIYQGINNLKIIYGNIPILLSAAHSVKHVRNGLFKNSDGLTGGIVEFLANYHNAFGITRVHNMLDDPNYYNYGISQMYKEKCLELIRNYEIKYFFDIHGCSNNHFFKIDIGTNNGLNINKDILDLLIKYFNKLGKVTIDNNFKASRSSNISKYLHEQTGISCYQIELCNELRFNKINETIIAFNELIDEIKIKKLK